MKENDLRNTYRSCLKLADETDSKKEDAILRAEAKSALTTLKEVCTHSLVIQMQTEYEGYHPEYEDAHPESRKCLVCDTGESKYPVKWRDPFQKLTTVTVDSRNNADLPQVQKPLNYLISEILEAVEEHRERTKIRHVTKSLSENLLKKKD